MKMTESFEIMFKNCHIRSNNAGHEFVKFDRENVNFNHILASFMEQYFKDQSIDVDEVLEVTFLDTMQAAELESSQNFVNSNSVKVGLVDLEILMLSKGNKKPSTKKQRKVIS